MLVEELSANEIIVLRRRIAIAAKFPELTSLETEALDSLAVKLRRYGRRLHLSYGERQRLTRIFTKAGALEAFFAR
jgi:hypothetical protein